MEPPEGADPRELAPDARAALRSLARTTADRVARHLVATGQLLDSDPQAALEQARAARAHAARVGPVREAVGIAAYEAGEWAEALAELRAARRLTGDPANLPVMADCERALGRPQRAIDLARSPEIAALDPAARVEMRIVESGARRDLGELQAALVTLQGPELSRRTVEPWTARLWYAYADTLLALGRTDDAREWFVATASIDEDGATDADDRVLAIDGVTVLDVAESDAAESDAGEFAAVESDAVKFDAGEFAVTETDVSQSDAEEFAAAESDVSQSDAAQAEAAQAEAAQAEAAKAEAGEGGGRRRLRPAKAEAGEG